MGKNDEKKNVSHGISFFVVMLFVLFCCNIIAPAKQKKLQISGSFPSGYINMLKSNFVVILRTLTREEFNSFVEFVPWALHQEPSKREEAVKLLDILIGYFPEFNHPSLTSKKIFKKMFPDKDYVELKIDKIMGSLTKCLRMHFLTFRYLEPKNEFNHLLEICQFHKEKGLSARYQQSLPQNLKEITYILAARRLEIKAFYEYDFEVSVFKAEAFRTYVSRLPSYNFPKETIIQQIPVLEEQFEGKPTTNPIYPNHFSCPTFAAY